MEGSDVAGYFETVGIIGPGWCQGTRTDLGCRPGCPRPRGPIQHASLSRRYSFSCESVSDPGTGLNDIPAFFFRACASLKIAMACPLEELREGGCLLQGKADRDYDIAFRHWTPGKLDGRGNEATVCLSAAGMPVWRRDDDGGWRTAASKAARSPTSTTRCLARVIAV